MIRNESEFCECVRFYNDEGTVFFWKSSGSERKAEKGEENRGINEKLRLLSHPETHLHGEVEMRSS